MEAWTDRQTGRQREEWVHKVFFVHAIQCEKHLKYLDEKVTFL
jgi:hypothetical protein